METNLNLKDQLIRFFYGTKIAFSLWFISLYSHTSLTGKEHAFWPVRWLANLDSSKEIIFILAVLLLFTQFLSLLNPLKPKIKYTEAFFYFVYFAALFSTQSLGHSFYSFILTSFFIASISNKDVHGIGLRRAQTIFLLGYTLSGLWKLRSLLVTIWHENSLSVLFTTLPHHLSFNLIQKGLDNPLSNFILAAPSFIHCLLWLTVVVFELACFLMIFKPSYHRVWGVMIVIFHASTSLIMNIHFIEAQLLAAILLVCTPFPQQPTPDFKQVKELKKWALVFLK